MQKTIIEYIANAICERRNANDWPCNGLDFDEELAKAALNATRNLVKYDPYGNYNDDKTVNEYIDKALNEDKL